MILKRNEKRVERRQSCDACGGFFWGLSQEQLEIHTVEKFLKARIRS
jgi:hypothetical protein